MISTVHQPFDTRIFHKEARSLARAGYSVYYIVRSEKGEEVDGVKIVPLPVFSSRITRMVLLPWVALRRALQIKADVYHFHDPELMFAAAALKLITQKIVIYDIHEDVPAQILNKDWIPKSMRKFVARLYRIVERALLRFYDALIVVGSGLAEQYKSSSKGKVVILANYPLVDNTAWLEMSDEVDKGSSLDAMGSQAVVYVGGLTQIRGVEQLLAAVAILKHQSRVPFTLKLVGPAQPPGYKQRLEEIIEKSRISDVVQLMGHVPYREALQIMRDAAVGVVTFLHAPNHISTAPTKLFEYMLAGLPVICSNFPLWQEIVSSTECGLTVNPESPQEIAKAIAYLLEHPEEAREMGKRGQRAVLQTYNWAREEEKLLALYERLLKERGAS
jgi:glycosyltransferase involved in cell wall biosynthesis